MVNVLRDAIKRGSLVAAALALSTPLLLILSVTIGPYKQVGFSSVLECLLGGCPPAAEAVVIRRLLRSLSAMVAGAGLAAAGVTLQHILRNPLADPYIIGVASGAGLGAIVAFALGVNNPTTVYLLALMGGTLAYTIVSMLSLVTGLRMLSFILAGVAVGYAAWALSVIVIVRYMARVQGGILWLFGSVAYVTRLQVLLSTILVAIPILWLIIRRKGLSALLLGDEVAEAAGYNVKMLRYEAFLASSALTAAAVALAGPIGFVGLVAPWLARALLGSIYARLLLFSSLMGGWMLLSSDILVRAVFAPVEVPLTAITSLIGVPVMVYIMSKFRGAQE